MSAEVVWSQSNYYTPKPIDRSWSIEAGHLTTRSIRGWKTGFTVEITKNNRWSLAYFNLSGKVNSEWATAEKSTYRGADVGYVFNPKGRLKLGMNIRMGMHEKQFISVLPGATARFAINDLININSSVAYSDGFPHFGMGLSVRLYAK